MPLGTELVNDMAAFIAPLPGGQDRQWRSCLQCRSNPSTGISGGSSMALSRDSRSRQAACSGDGTGLEGRCIGRVEAEGPATGIALKDLVVRK